MKDNIKLIATDLDGTLLRDYAPVCSKEAIVLMSELCKKGVYIVPASGRQYPNLYRMFEQVDGAPVFLCENGALVIYQEQVLLKRKFEQKVALELCEMILERPECEVLISGERTSYLIPKSAAYVDYMENHIKNDVTIVNRPEDIKEPIIKVSYWTEEKYCKAVTEAFLPQIEGKCLITVSGNEWVDFAPFETSKGTALAAIGEKLNIKPEEMVAFGDNENDRSMLEFVGHPYLMQDCNPSMEDIKAKRCSRVEDELAKILAEM